jgi:lipoprotein releasing system LolC/E family transmembrane protein
MRRSTPALFAAFFLGPVLLLLNINAALRLTSPKRLVRSICIIFSAAAFVTLFCMAVFYVCHTHYLMSGEALQMPMGTSFALSGFLVGVTFGVLFRRVAFLEGLWATALVGLFYLPFRFRVHTLFSFGTIPAYFGAILFTLFLLLLLGLTLGGAFGYLLFGEGRYRTLFGYEALLGRRFLLAKRTSNVISVITYITIFAVATGCASMIVVMSIMNGFSTDIKTKILGANAHLLVFKYGKSFSEYETVVQRTEAIENVKEATPFVLEEVMISSGDGIKGGLLKGIPSTVFEEKGALGKYIVTGRRDFSFTPESNLKGNDELEILPGIVIGTEMAKALHISLGDAVNVISPLGDLGPQGPVPKTKAFRVSALFYSGMYEYDSSFAYIALSEAQHFFGLKNSVQGVEFRLRNIDETETTSRKVLNVLGGYPYYTRDWMQMNRNIFSALKIEKIAMFLILVALVCMASLLILVALIMVVIEKGRDIAILKSIGMSDVSVAKIFVTYGVIIGSVGAFLGLILGVFLCSVVKSLGIGLDPSVHYISEIPVRMDFFEIGAVLASALTVSFLATLPPSLFAARQNPVDGLRYD